MSAVESRQRSVWIRWHIWNSSESREIFCKLMVEALGRMWLGWRGLCADGWDLSFFTLDTMKP